VSKPAPESRSSFLNQVMAKSTFWSPMLMERRIYNFHDSDYAYLEICLFYDIEWHPEKWLGYKRMLFLAKNHMSKHKITMKIVKKTLRLLWKHGKIKRKFNIKNGIYYTPKIQKS
jgi:hypothetical protein